LNKTAGATFERTIAEKLSEQRLEFAQQITVETPSGARTRLDSLVRDPVTNEIICIEAKSSKTARVTRVQRRAFNEMLRDGATIVGDGKPGFPGGMKIPPTKVQILRPPEVIE
jgi:hypothetical protein